MNLRLSNSLNIALFAVALLLSCSKSPQYEQGRLSIKPERADFGTIEPGDPIAFREVLLTARNLGRQPLEIKKIEVPEGFAGFITPGNVIKAGETASVKITMDIRNFSASVSQKAYILSTDPAQPRLAIPVEVKITERPASRQAEVAGEPDIRFDSRAVALGPILRNEKIEHNFTFKNIGKKPLVIYSIKTMCVCISGRPSMVQVPPGGSAAIIATIEPYKYAGKDPWKSLTVATNDSDEPVIDLTVSATIVDPAALDPEVVLLPGVQSGHKAEADVKLIQRAGRDLIIKEIKTSSPRISVERSPLEGSQKGYLLRVMLAPDMPTGTFEEMVTIFTNYENAPAGAVSEWHKDYSRLELPVKGRVTGAISVSPEKINFGNGAPGKAVRRKLVISSSDSEFDIQSLSLSDPSFRVSYNSIEPKRKYEITIEFLPGPVERRIENKLVIKTTETVIEVPIFASVKFNS